MPRSTGSEAAQFLSSKSYLSIVVTGRNDDHGGDLTKRMQLFINGLLEQCRRHDLDAELIVVDWNPPASSLRIADAYSWPAENSPCSVRIVEVPASIHDRFKNAAQIPLFQFIAKNVGIRRARGEFVLATNVDIFFTDALVTYLAEKLLDPSCFYRANRFDVPLKAPTDLPLQQRLDYYHENVMRIYLRDGTRSFISGKFHRIYPPAWAGRYGRSVIAAERVGAAVSTTIRSFLRDPEYRGKHLGIQHYRSRIQSGHYPELLRQLFDYMQRPQRARLHTNASGDFTLMAKEAWQALRGYPELPLHGMHIDSLICYMAYYLPLREVVLPDPMRIYHIEHESGWTPEAAWTESFDERLRDQGVSRLSHERLDEMALQMEEAGRPLARNEEAWGLALEDLPQIVIHEAE